MPNTKAFQQKIAAALALSLFSIAPWPRALRAQETPSIPVPRIGDTERAAPYVPTPMAVARQMLELARVSKVDTVYDLGSGDGRIVIMAAKDFGAAAVGIELNDYLASQSEDKIKKMGLQKAARIIHGDLFKVDLRPATVVTVYLLTVMNERLRPKFEKELLPGTQIVCHDFRIPGWEPKQVLHVKSENGLPHTLYLYVR